jgi:hypothetical protein
MQTRTIQITKHEAFDNTIGDPHHPAVLSAIGYLSCWAIHNDRYCSLILRCTEEGNIVAVYKNSAGDVTYDMLALRRDDGSYSYHS